MWLSTTRTTNDPLPRGSRLRANPNVEVHCPVGLPRDNYQFSKGPSVPVKRRHKRCPSEVLGALSQSQDFSSIHRRFWIVAVSS